MLHIKKLGRFFSDVILKTIFESDGMSRNVGCKWKIKSYCDVLGLMPSLLGNGTHFHGYAGLSIMVTWQPRMGDFYSRKASVSIGPARCCIENISHKRSQLSAREFPQRVASEKLVPVSARGELRETERRTSS
jgi:hypothetical protein